MVQCFSEGMSKVVRENERTSGGGSGGSSSRAPSATERVWAFVCPSFVRRSPELRRPVTRRVNAAVVVLVVVVVVVSNDVNVQVQKASSNSSSSSRRWVGAAE